MNSIATRVLPLFLVVSSAAYSQTPQATLQTMIEHETVLLQFIGGGSPLTQEERNEAAQIVRDAMRDPGAHWTEVEEREARAVAIVRSGDGKAVGALWDGSRYNYEFQPGTGPLARYFAVEKRIIQAHDPVLFVDAKNGRVFTRHMLLALRASAVWAAAMHRLPMPAANFDAVIQENLPDLRTQDPDITDAMVHIARYQPYALPFFNSLPQERRDKFFSNHSMFNNLDKSDSETWQMAQAGAMESRFAARSSATAASVGDRAYGAQMNNMWLGNAARSLSPACNPTLSTAARTQNNCIAPIPVPGVH